VATFTALYDSCVLYPAPLRDLLVRLGGTGLFRARWTNEIHEEWIRNVLENRSDLSRERLERTRDLMNEHIFDSLVTDYADLIPSLVLPDADDRHVVAAAIRGRADVIVTFNLKDFPSSALSPYNIEPQHPDVFVQHLLDLNEALVCATIRQQRLDLRKPPKPIEDVLNTFDAQGLKQSVGRLRSLTAFL
jgi:hypothetical protein